MQFAYSIIVVGSTPKINQKRGRKEMSLTDNYIFQ